MDPLLALIKKVLILIKRLLRFNYRFHYYVLPYLLFALLVAATIRLFSVEIIPPITRPLNNKDDQTLVHESKPDIHVTLNLGDNQSDCPDCPILTGIPTGQGFSWLSTGIISLMAVLVALFLFLFFRAYMAPYVDDKKKERARKGLWPVGLLTGLITISDGKLLNIEMDRPEFQLFTLQKQIAHDRKANGQQLGLTKLSIASFNAGETSLDEKGERKLMEVMDSLSSMDQLVAIHLLGRTDRREPTNQASIHNNFDLASARANLIKAHLDSLNLDIEIITGVMGASYWQQENKPDSLANDRRVDIYALMSMD